MRFVLFTFSSGIVRREYMLRIVNPSFYPGGFCFIYVYFRRDSREYMRFVLFTFSSGIVRREYMLRIVKPSFYPGGFCFIYVFFRRGSREYMRKAFLLSRRLLLYLRLLQTRQSGICVKPSFYPGGFCFIYFFPYLLRNPFRKYLTDFQNINKPFFTL